MDSSPLISINWLELIKWSWEVLRAVSSAFFTPVAVGLALYYAGLVGEDRKLEADAIRDLMTYRGDFASTEFSRSLNKVSIIFHNDESIRSEVRHLYEVINNPSSNSENTKRTIVGLIYKLCQKNKFKGLTEYDIDQAFAESKQTPNENSDPRAPVPLASKIEIVAEDKSASK